MTWSLWVEHRPCGAAKVALQLAERGFFAKEMNVGWKEWTHNRHPTHQGKAEIDGVRCSCSK